MSSTFNQERANRRRSLSAAPIPYQLENTKSKTTFLSLFKNPITPASQSQSPTTNSNINTTTINTNDNRGLPSITLQHQKIKRKSIPSNTEFSLLKNNDKNNETVRGMKKAEYDNPVPESTNSKKKTLTTTGTGFSRIFRMRSKSIDVKKPSILESVPPFVLSDEMKKFELPPLPLLNASTDLEFAQFQKPKETQPESFPAKKNYNSTTTKPMPTPNTISNINKTNNTNNNTSKNSNNNNSTDTVNARFSTASTRKSSASYSIYSTFGSSDSIHYGDNSSGMITSNSTIDLIAEPENKNNTPQAQPDLLSIVTNNLQLRTQARVIPNAHLSSENETDSEEEVGDDEDDDDDDESLNEDVFVDATDFSQEELEKEKIESRLSKRLSGGHFGSAGGLMVSIMSVTTADDSKQRRRISRPPPEDVAKSMLDWKRKSGQGLNAFSKDMKQEITSIIETDESNIVENNDNNENNNSEEKKLEALSPSPEPEKPIRHPSPNRPLPPLPNIVLTDDRNNTDDEQAAKDAAAKLWNEDESFVQREQIAEWLGQSKPLNTKTLDYYMNYFDFAQLRIDSAFRKLCSKLYFKAEAQQIDRILESFAKRYWECNKKTIFGSIDVVYAVVYSLLLLNTDLHVAQGSYTRMTRNAFVKNTMSTIRDQQAALGIKRSQSYTLAWESNVESYLKDLYTSVKHNQILQPNANQNDSLNPLVGHDMFLQKPGGKRISEFKKGINTMIQKSTSIRESILFPDEPTPRKSTSSAKINFLHSPRRGSFSSIHSVHSPSSPSSSFLGGAVGGGNGLGRNGKGLSSPNQNMPIMQFMDAHGADLFANRPPYIKEGIVMRKHLLISANQKAKHREWKECLLVVSQGELNMYALQGNNNATTDHTKKNALLRAGSASFTNLADTLSKNNPQSQQQGSISFGGVSQHSKGWAEHSQPLDSVKLNHTLSNPLPPPGYNRNRPHVFALQESNGGVYLFQTASHTQLSEWVMTCNYWAARKSKEPLPGGIGNLEYGWGACLNDVILDLDAVENNKKVTGNYINDPDSVHLARWDPPAPTMVSSILSEKDHFEALEKYLISLNQEINEHREIKKKLLVKFPPKCQNYHRALTNWESKSNHLLHEIIKYQNYCNVLEESIMDQVGEKIEITNMSTDNILLQ